MKHLSVIVLALILFFGSSASSADGDITVKDLRCEYLVNPLGIDSVKPRLSWIIESTQRGAIQSAYQILVASSEEKLNADKGDLWDSRKVKSNKTIHIVYAGKELKLQMRCYWKVRVWDKKGNVSAWSGPAYWSMGLLKPSDWKAKWIGQDGPAPQEEYTRLAARMLRREYQIEKKVKRATAYVCGLGLFELYLNGQKVSNNVEDPALTMYTKRALYVTFDITDKLKQGANAAGVILGNGRYFAPRKTVPFSSTYYFGYPRLLLQMEVEYEDGSTSTLVSDEAWKPTTEGPIRANNEYDGEEYDARMEQVGWDEAGFDDSKWEKVQLVQEPGGILAAQMIEPMRVTETIKPIAVTNPKPGMYVYDMGQNMVGWARLTVSGPKGTSVILRFAESLQDDGALYLDNLRRAKVTDIYTLKGEGVEIWEPRFVAHGFRFVEMTGFPGEPNLGAIEGRVSHTNMEIGGEFSCSNPLINQIYKSIVWTIRGNYRGLPTDCPQRAERQGWLGDPAERSKGESYAFSVQQFYAKWLDDIKDGQKDDGDLPNIAPPFFVPSEPHGAPPSGFVTIPSSYSLNVTWPSAYVMIAGWYYEQYGDERILEKHYPSMKKWMDLLKKSVKNDTISLDKYGDWCVPPESPKLVHSADPSRKTSGELLATAYFYHDLRLMAKYAQILGKKNDAKQFDALAEKIKKAFNKKFFDKETALYGNGTQTSSVLPLAFGMVPEGYRQRVFSNLVENIIIKSDRHIGTGLVGSQWLMRTLSENGRPNVAYMLATQKTYPSWGYMIEKGATTMWELWNGDTANPSMNSRNHLMLVGDMLIWFYENLAGIKCDPAGPGYEKIIIKPTTCGDLMSVKGQYKSVRGLIVSNWHRDSDIFYLSVTIPANTTATVYIPTADVDSVTEGGKKASEAEGVKFLRAEPNAAVYSIGGGNYFFAAKGIKLTSAVKN